MRRYPAESLADVKNNLRALGVTLWPGVAYDLTDEKDLDAAAEWLCEAACAAGLIPTREEAQEQAKRALDAARKRSTPMVLG